MPAVVTAAPRASSAMRAASVTRTAYGSARTLPRGTSPGEMWRQHETAPDCSRAHEIDPPTATSTAFATPGTATGAWLPIERGSPAPGS